MPQADLTLDQVGRALKTCGHYRVVRVQELAAVGAPDRISGPTVLALGLRETFLRNINGGAVKDATGTWVEAPPIEQDGGFLQISRVHHRAELRRMLAVKEGTWGPVMEGYTAFDPGYCPRFSDSVRFTLEELHDNIAFAEDHGLPDDKLLKFAIAAHNAGPGGALEGYKANDIDLHTAHGDYSAWVLRHRKLIQEWLGQHVNWRF